MTERDGRRAGMTAVSLTVLAILLAVAASAWLAFGCISRTESEVQFGSGESSVTSSCESLLESEPALAVGLFLVPIGLAVLGWRLAGSRRSVLWAGLLLLGFCGLAILSVGIFYVPAGIALVLAGMAPRHPPEAEPDTA